MKNLAIAFLSAAAAVILMPGCSKSKPASSAADQAATQAPASNSAAAADPVSGDSADMRIKWPVGVKYSMRMELVQSVETKVPNLPEPVVQKVNMAQNFEIGAVKELPDGGRQLELQFQSQTMEVAQNGNVVMKFDSSGPASQDPAGSIQLMLRKMIGPKIQYFTTATGSVEKVEGVDELMNQMGFNRKSQEQAMFKEMFSEETLRRYGEFGEMMPNREVKLGDSWTVKRTIPTGAGKLDANMTYTFKKWEQQNSHRCALLGAKGDLASTPGGTAAQPVKIENGKVDGDVWFDPALGMVIIENINQDMVLKVMAGGQSFAPHVSQRIHISLLDTRGAP